MNEEGVSLNEPSSKPGLALQRPSITSRQFNKKIVFNTKKNINFLTITWFCSGS